MFGVCHIRSINRKTDFVLSVRHSQNGQYSTLVRGRQRVHKTTGGEGAVCGGTDINPCEHENALRQDSNLVWHLQDNGDLRAVRSTGLLADLNHLRVKL